jgi:hypothetical protein
LTLRQQLIATFSLLLAVLANTAESLERLVGRFTVAR